MVETAALASDPEFAGAGLSAQYVLSVEVSDLVAPIVTAVNALPQEGDSLPRPVSTFSVNFSEDLNVTTLTNDSFDLREAGADGLFDTADDRVYNLASSYNASTFRVDFNITDGPLADGNYRFTIADSVTDLLGNQLDGDVDVVAGGNFIRNFIVDALPDGHVFEGSSNNSFERAASLELTADTNGTGWLQSEIGYGTIDPSTDTDWWSFQGELGDFVDVWSQPLEGMSPFIRLYRLNEAGDGVQELANDFNQRGPGNTAYISGFELPASTTYFVEVGRDGGSAIGTYDVRVNLQRDHVLETDASYSNDSTGGADSLTFVEQGNTRSATIAGTIMSGENGNVDEDYFALGRIFENEEVELLISVPTWSILNPIIEIRNSLSEVVGVFEESLGTSVFFEPLVEDEYFVTITTSTGEGILGQYALEIIVSSLG